MNALDELKKKNYENTTALERALLELWCVDGYEYLAEKAAAELAAKDAEIERLQAERDALREALREILTDSTWDDCKETALAALAEDK